MAKETTPFETIKATPQYPTHQVDVPGLWTIKSINAAQFGYLPSDVDYYGGFATLEEVQAFSFKLKHRVRIIYQIMDAVTIDRLRWSQSISNHIRYKVTFELLCKWQANPELLTEFIQQCTRLSDENI